jgi:putative FmdB family regulatory protein
MPIFEYVCQDCENRFEALVNGGSAKAKCPACASAKLEQQYSAFAVGSAKGKGRFGKSATSGSTPRGGCGTCGDPRGPGSCSN